MLIHAYKKKDVMTISLITLQLELSMLAFKILYKCQHIMRNAIKLNKKKKVIYTKNND